MDAGFHHARSVRSPRTRPGSNGQPPSPAAGWAHLYRVGAPWAGSVPIIALDGSTPSADSAQIGHCGPVVLNRMFGVLAPA